MRILQGALLLAAWMVVGTSCQDTLRPMNVLRHKLSLSGYSSGGTMAQMLQFSYSSMFCGIAVFSHSYYRCGPPSGDVVLYDRFCTTTFNSTEFEIYNPDLVHQDIQNYFNRGIIENPKNLKNTRLYVYSGVRNSLFTPRMAFNILRVYEPYIQSLQYIKTRLQDATQLLPTNHYGKACSESAENNHWIGNCGFSGVTEAINFLLFDNYDQSEAFQKVNTQRGSLSVFDQTEFTRDLKDHHMDTVGYYYVPKQCQYNNNRSPCFLHFYFHGCFTGREFSGPLHAENTGLLELAERKNIIMIFPQALSSLPQNRIGCWDTFGISGEFYATQQGPQVTAIKRMLDRILGTQAPQTNKGAYTFTTTV